MTRYVRVRGALQCYWSRYQLVERTTEVTLDRVLAIDDADGNDEEMLLDQLEADGVLVDPNGDVPRDSDWMHDSSAFGNLAWATVSAEEYEQALAYRAMQKHAVGTLFELDGGV